MQIDIVSDVAYWTARIEEAFESINEIHIKMYGEGLHNLTVEELFALREAMGVVSAANANLKSDMLRCKRQGKFKAAKAILKSDRWI